MPIEQTVFPPRAFKYGPNLLRAEWLRAEIDGLVWGRHPTADQSALADKYMRELDELYPRLTADEHALLAWSEF